VSVLPRYRAFAGPAFLTVLTVLLLGGSVGIVTPASAHGSVIDPTLPSMVSCPGNVLPHNYSGTVTTGPSVAASSVSLAYSYEAEVVNNLTSGTVLSSTCSSENGTTTPSENGSFSMSIYPTPDITCEFASGGHAGRCVSVEGPYELVSVTPTSPIPPGYFPSVVQNGTTFDVGIFPYLGSVVLTPSTSAATFSAGARDAFQATPLTGGGTPTPGRMVPRYDWTLTGVGWTFESPSNGPFLNVTAASGAGIGNLSVVATLSVSGATLTTPSVFVELLAVATTITSASMNRTTLDVGESANVTVAASGAAGYPYSISVTPGLGGPNAPGSCVASPRTGGTSALSCTVVWSYASVGVAQPVVTVSNGNSTATWPFPDVTVDPAPSVVVSPALPVGYANASIAIVVKVVNGTGTLPYRLGCLAAAGHSPECIDLPGTAWSFSISYPAPGEYPVTAWSVDATGANRSATTDVRVVAPLRVALTSDATSPSVGTAIPLVASVAGGDLPAEVWWNTSGSSSSVASEPVSSDGLLDFTLSPSISGELTVSVTVRDDLGTAVSASETWTVRPGAATAVLPVLLPPTSSIRAGSPLSIDWQALDSAGESVHTFASPAEIELALAGSGRTAAGWVNASGIGPLVSQIPGWFDVPATAWIAGALNVSVTSRVSGPIAIDLIVAVGLPSGGDVVNEVVLPDVDHLRLLDPDTILSGDRANETLWQATDRFGNPAPGASVVTTSSFDGTSQRTVTPVLSEPDGATQVWVNYSAPNLFAGTVTVTDLGGDVLLPPISVEGLAGPWTPFLSELSLPLGLVAGVGVGGGALLRRRHDRATESAPAEDDETALQRLAEGRATIVEILRRVGPLDLAGLAVSWEPLPAPPEIADWVASLLTDGTLDASFGDDGVARFCLPKGTPSREQVVLDVDAFDRAQSRRDDARAEWEREDP
jgi:hypothetical protein